MSKIQKIRNFSFLIYPESAVNDWQTVLASFFLPCFYVFHDKDNKKPHYHVLVTPNNAISVNTVNTIVTAVGGANGCYERVTSTVGYARYLCHMDNPEKYQYLPDDVVCLCGADYQKITRTKSDEDSARLRVFREIFKFIRDNNFVSYAYFLDYCLDNEPSWFALAVSSHGRVIKDYIKSMYWMSMRP